MSDIDLTDLLDRLGNGDRVAVLRGLTTRREFHDGDTAVTLIDTDHGLLLHMLNDSDAVVTVGATFATGNEVTIFRRGAGAVSIALPIASPPLDNILGHSSIISGGVATLLCLVNPDGATPEVKFVGETQ